MLSQSSKKFSVGCCIRDSSNYQANERGLTFSGNPYSSTAGGTSGWSTGTAGSGYLGSNYHELASLWRRRAIAVAHPTDFLCKTSFRENHFFRVTVRVTVGSYSDSALNDLPDSGLVVVILRQDNFPSHLPEKPSILETPPPALGGLDVGHCLSECHMRAGRGGGRCRSPRILLARIFRA